MAKMIAFVFAAMLGGVAAYGSVLAPTDLAQQCQQKSDQYIIYAGHSWGMAPADVQRWWTENHCNANPTVDDMTIHITTEEKAKERRKRLITYIWGVPKLPNAMPLVKHNVGVPLEFSHWVHQADRLHIDMGPGEEEGLAFHYVPTKPNNRLVVLHHGHACHFVDAGNRPETHFNMTGTIVSLLKNGYSLLLVYMPHYHPDGDGECTHDDPNTHDAMFADQLPQASAMRYFLEPVAVSLNYLLSGDSAHGIPSYGDHPVAMIGLSGGGWTTTVYSAIDPRIALSIPVAGSLPLRLRFATGSDCTPGSLGPCGNSIGDTEQNRFDFYQIAGYPDLYVLGAYGDIVTGTGKVLGKRRQVQVLNRNDDCCFGERQHIANRAPGYVMFDQAVWNYTIKVQKTLGELHGGSFDRVIDDAADRHMISQWTVDNVILKELKWLEQH